MNTRSRRTAFTVAGAIIALAAVLWFYIKEPATKPEPAAAAMTECKIISLNLPASSDELIAVQVQAGPLPFGAKVEVSSADGTLLGTIAPFGRTAQESGGIHTILVPGPRQPGPVEFQFTLVPRDQPRRAPTDEEIPGASIRPRD